MSDPIQIPHSDPSQGCGAEECYCDVPLAEIPAKAWLKEGLDALAQASQAFELAGRRFVRDENFIAAGVISAIGAQLDFFSDEMDVSDLDSLTEEAARSAVADVDAQDAAIDEEDDK